MSAEKLFTPLKVGAVTAPNRVFMAPLTRLRSIEPGDIPTPLMGEYYRQRASSGLIITEATQISAQAKGYAAHRPAQPGADCRTEENHRWRSRRRGSHCGSAVAHRSYLSQQHSARRSGAGFRVGPECEYPHFLRDENGNAIRVDTSTPRALELDEIRVS